MNRSDSEKLKNSNFIHLRNVCEMSVHIGHQTGSRDEAIIETRIRSLGTLDFSMNINNMETLLIVQTPRYQCYPSEVLRGQ